MFYFKKIVSYFDYYENHEKKKNCGYGKILIRDEEVTLEIHIRGLGNKESHMCDICVDQNREKQLGRFVLDKGTGYYNARFHSRDMDGDGLSVFDINGLFIPIDENKYCETCWEWGELPINIIIKDKIQGMEKEKMEESVDGQTEEKAAESRPADLSAAEGQAAAESMAEPGMVTQESAAGPEEGERETAISETEKPETMAPEIETETEKPETLVPEMETEAEISELTVPETDIAAEKPETMALVMDIEAEKPKITVQEINIEAEKSETAVPGRNAVATNAGNGEAEPAGGKPEAGMGAPGEVSPMKETAAWKNTVRSPETAQSERPLHKVQLQSMGNRAQNRNSAGKIPVQDPLHADKWKQLCSQYPVCHPFEDGEEYITIAPKDFIILRKEYQNLVSNSFLLHSFYNYHHVILGKAGKDEGDMYYIGVPGNYLDREKRVAVMFGFEGFAMSARGNRSRNVQRRERAPVEAGAFGYYMRKVEI